MKFIYLITCCFLFKLNLLSVTYVDYFSNPNLIFTVTNSFNGDVGLSKFNDVGIYVNSRNAFYATAVSSRHLVTVNHVGPRIGDTYTNNNNQSVVVIRSKILNYTNTTGGLVNVDLVLLTIDRPIKFWYPMSSYVPSNGTPVLAFGRTIANANPRTNSSSTWYDFEKQTWTFSTNQSIIYSDGWNIRKTQRVWFRGYYLQYKDFYYGGTPFTNIWPEYYNGLTAGIVPLNKPQNGSASTGDSGSPAFVWQGNTWKFVMPLQTASKYPRTNSNTTMGPPVHLFLPSILKTINDEGGLSSKPSTSPRTLQPQKSSVQQHQD